MGRPSVPPEQLLRALLLQILFTVRSERQLMEQMRYNLLFRWFVGLTMDEAVWDASTFSANRELLPGCCASVFWPGAGSGAMAGLGVRRTLQRGRHADPGLGIAQEFQAEGRRRAALQRRAQRRGRLQGEKRSNATHASTTDPDARLYRKSDAAPAVLGYLAHGLMENRSGLIVDAETAPASGTAERDAAITMLQRSVRKQGATLGGDKGYDTKDFVRARAPTA